MLCGSNRTQDKLGIIQKCEVGGEIKAAVFDLKTGMSPLMKKEGYFENIALAKKFLARNFGVEDFQYFGKDKAEFFKNRELINDIVLLRDRWKKH